MSVVTVEKVEEPKQPKKYRKRLFTNGKRKNKQINKQKLNPRNRKAVK